MRWLVFGDDWGRHPSTTQHLVRALPEHDEVLWLNSLGMRAPRFRLSDARRVWGALRGRPQDPGERAPRHILRPRVLPWHDRFTAWNAASLARQVHALCPGPFHVLAANPVASLYLDALRPEHVTYLRLDDYARLPGVDAELIAPLEERMIQRAELVAYTAHALRPSGLDAERSLYLPQGVDSAHFGRRRPTPARRRVLGFFGLLAEWLDAELIVAVANALPQWTLEFLGPVRRELPAWASLPNIRIRPAVPYARLPEEIAHWSAAWIPFERSLLTDGVNPLKLREYLAAGLPAASTPLPEVAHSGLDVAMVHEASQVVRWLEAVALEPRDAACRRRLEMKEHSWSARAACLRTRAAGPRGIS